MTRLEPVTPDVLDDDQTRLYRELTDGPRGRAGDVPVIDSDGALLGPFAVMAIAPAVGFAVQSVGSALRYHCTLDPLVREAAVLAVAAHHGSRFEWRAHEGPARALGLTDVELETISRGQQLDSSTPAAAVATRAVAQLLDENSLDDRAFSEARDMLGEQGLAELVWLVGYYSMLALSLAVFDPKDRNRDTFRTPDGRPDGPQR